MHFRGNVGSRLYYTVCHCVCATLTPHIHTRNITPPPYMCVCYSYPPHTHAQHHPPPLQYVNVCVLLLPPTYTHATSHPPYSMRLYHMAPPYSVGQLNHERQLLIKNTRLWQLASRLGLTDYMLVNRKVEGCQEHAGANCLEALLGAVYLDSGDVEQVDQLFARLAFPEQVGVWCGVWCGRVCVVCVRLCMVLCRRVLSDGQSRASIH